MTGRGPGERRSRRLRGDAAMWALVEQGTRRLAEHTAESLRAQHLAERLTQTYARLEMTQRAGHFFELIHATAFNRDAIAKGASVRATVTGLAGDPTGPVDVQLLDQGLRVAEAQAKLLCTASRTAVSQAQANYKGMQRLVAADQLEDITRRLDKRLTLNPEGIRYDDFVDARAHVTDHLQHGDVGSAPVNRADALRAADRPRHWAARQVAGAGVRQVGLAAAQGAAVGAVLTGVIEAGAQVARVRAGETSVAAAASTAAGVAARGAVRSGVLAGLGETVRVAAAAGALPKVLGAGTLPTAVASAAAGVAEAGIAFVRGEISAADFAGRSCEATLQTGLMWACGAAGQTVLPVPVVGALVGGLVGQLCATLIAQGLRTAVARAREDGLPEEQIALLEAEACAAVATAVVLADAEHALGVQRYAQVTSTVLPLLDDALHAVAEGSDDSLQLMIELTEAFAGQPLFRTVDEFDKWMNDPTSTLVLNPNAL